MYKSIFVNQCGYLPNMTKRVTFRSDSPVGFDVITTDGHIVYHGTASIRVENPCAGETDYVGNFSPVTAPGRYRIVSHSPSESDTFEIADNVYEDVFRKAFAFFYLQRCGCDLPKSAAGMFAHRACHTKIATVYGTGEKLDVTGGWHDAGDYGRYIVPGVMAAAQLLYAFEENPELCAVYTAPGGEGGPEAHVGTETQADSGSHAGPDAYAFPGNEVKLPPCLEEIKYELDWMLKLQREDGQLYHKASCHRFCAMIMPDTEQDDIVVSPVSATATADFAAVTAMAVRFYKKYDPAYADKLAAASRKAYDALRTMEASQGFKNPPGINTGGYGDPHDTDERYWAAAELYKAFGDESYREDFERLAEQQIFHGYGWGNMGSYGNRAYLTTAHPTDTGLKEKITAAMIALAEEKLRTASSDGYGTSLPIEHYYWGSNMAAANNGLHMYDAYRITGRRDFLDAAGDQLHYLLGRNPMGLCYLTGCGTDAIKHPHHRPSAYLGKAMPGMLSGGPCGRRADPTAKGVLPEEYPPAKALVDMFGSYSTNEVAIYWNSAFVQLLASVVQAENHP